MTCDDIRPRLTAYLDGDLNADRGTVIRGHLRTCDACRVVAEREATLRDGLRMLPTVDPPAGMWSSIQAQLAAAEVVEAQRPAWKRAVARWMPTVPRFAAGGALAAAAVAVLWWRTREPEPEPTAARLVDTPSPEIKASRPEVVTPAMPGCVLLGPSDGDVTVDLASEAARVTSCYAQTSTELFALATEARGTWTDAQRATFDAKVGELRVAVDRAVDGRARQRAWRALNRFLQNTITRDDIALASAAP
jgi:hypothetical protein